MFGLFSYFRKEVNVSDNAAGLNLEELNSYIISKKYSKTALAIGKYYLALYIKEDVEKRIKKGEIEPEVLQRLFYIAYMVNEFLERPDRYTGYKQQMEDGSFEALPLVFADRWSPLLELQDSNPEKEMARLFQMFATMLLRVTVPNHLPDYIKPGWGSANLHRIIKDLFEQSKAKCRIDAPTPAIMSQPNLPDVSEPRP